MIDPKKLEQLARQVQESLPQGIRDLGDDVEKKIRQVLKNQFSRMSLVSREEFDVQTQILLHTREKLSQLELRLKTLETMPKSDLLVSQVAPAGPAMGVPVAEAKLVGISDEDDITRVFPAEQAVPKVSDADNKPTKDTFKKL